MAESELIKESRKAALRRTDKMYEKNKIDLGKIVSEAMNKQEDTPQYITKKQKPFITKKSPEEIRERGMTEKASGGRIGLRGGGICKRGMN